MTNQNICCDSALASSVLADAETYFWIDFSQGESVAESGLITRHCFRTHFSLYVVPRGLNKQPPTTRSTTSPEANVGVELGVPVHVVLQFVVVRVVQHQHHRLVPLVFVRLHERQGVHGFLQHLAWDRKSDGK